MLDHLFYLIFYYIPLWVDFHKKAINTQDMPPSRILAADYRSDKIYSIHIFWSFQKVIREIKKIPYLNGFTGNITTTVFCKQ
jgi:hypothetical protein